LDSFGARSYLSAYGRWGSVDPLSEKHPAWSPYAYVLANPLKLVDPDGRQVAAITGTCCMELMTFEKAGDQYLRRRDQFQLQREQGSYLKAAATLVWAPIELGLNVLGAADPVGLMGGVSAVGMADDAARVLSQADDLARAATAIDRGGLTAAGRALQKHGGREGSAFPAAKGNPLSINQQGQNIVDEILGNRGSTTVIRNHPRFGQVTEVRAPDGRGLRYGPDGKFIGFLEPQK
jgi:hypothetical protein